MNKELLSGFTAISEIINAFELQKNDVIDIIQFQEQTIQFLEAVLDEIDAVCNMEAYSSESEEGILFATAHTALSTSEAINRLLLNRIPNLSSNEDLSIPIILEPKNHESITIQTQGEDRLASKLVQELLLSVLKSNNNMHFRCGDFVRNGTFFSSVYGLVNQLPAISGGEVYSKSVQFDDLITEIENKITKSMSILGASGLTVNDYNRSANAKLELHTYVLYLNDPEYDYSNIKRLVSLVENGKRTGISFIIVGNENVCEYFSNCVDLNLIADVTTVSIANKETVNLILNEICDCINEDVDIIVREHKNANQVETQVSEIGDLGLKCQNMDSIEVLRIPFAYDNDNNLQYFEIGGEAPSHALISGSTGSGKSVALHTLIMQIAYNYHPDDVEIWAIDYKAVEFDSYMDYKTPHFRVIAHDTSTEFSLSLLDLLYEEYNSRMKQFLEEGVKNIKEYREKCGAHSMPRIVVFIDEFQLMTQAVQTYTGNTDYKTILENLLRLTRAMGISFILCSQTIASGLSGLTDSARDQIGCRLSLKHDDDNEIRETLMLWGADYADVAVRARNLRRGEGIYRRNRFANEESIDGKPFEFINVHVLYLNDSIKHEMIEEVNSMVETDYRKKDEIFVRGGGRISVAEKERHPFSQFIKGDRLMFEDDCFGWYPAAPTTLMDYYCIQIENSSGANMLMVGENDSLRDSVILHSICGFLMNPCNTVYANFLDPEYSDRRRIIEILRDINSDRLTINEDISSVVGAIGSMRKIRPLHGENRIFLWYGLEKLKNELFLLEQEKDDIISVDNDNTSRTDKLDELVELLTDLNSGTSKQGNSEMSFTETLSHDDCIRILKQSFEAGPENGYYHFAVFNSYKGLKKSNTIPLECFENRIGTKMSVDDSFELFGSSLAVDKADESTVIYYPGSGKVTPLRPYLMPDKDWINAFNNALMTREN